MSALPWNCGQVVILHDDRTWDKAVPAMVFEHLPSSAIAVCVSVIRLAEHADLQ
jgi:hypothetical protein